MVTFVTSDPSGRWAGTGSPILPAQVDENFYELQQAVDGGCHRRGWQDQRPADSRLRHADRAVHGGEPESPAQHAARTGRGIRDGPGNGRRRPVGTTDTVRRSGRRNLAWVRSCHAIGCRTRIGIIFLTFCMYFIIIHTIFLAKMQTFKKFV